MPGFDLGSDVIEDRLVAVRLGTDDVPVIGVKFGTIGFCG